MESGTLRYIAGFFVKKSIYETWKRLEGSRLYEYWLCLHFQTRLLTVPLLVLTLQTLYLPDWGEGGGAETPKS